MYQTHTKFSNTRREILASFERLFTILLVSVASPRPSPAQVLRTRSPEALFNDGFTLNPKVLAQFENDLRSQPDNIHIRTIVAGYYVRQQSLIGNFGVSASLRDHLIEIIVRHPSSRIAGSRALYYSYIMPRQLFEDLSEKWEQTLLTYPSNPSIIANAASFWHGVDKGKCETLLLRAEELDPFNELWPTRLGHSYRDWFLEDGHDVTLAGRALSAYERAWDRASPFGKIDLLPDLAYMALKSHNIDKCERAARALLDAAHEYPSYDIYGDAVHIGNTILGLAALESADFDRAEYHLLQAGRTTGSAVLRSFGPSMELPQELLRIGRAEIVIEYLELCKIFWISGLSRIDRWVREIESGRLPVLKGARYP